MLLGIQGTVNNTWYIGIIVPGMLGWQYKMH